MASNTNTLGIRLALRGRAEVISGLRDTSGEVTRLGRVMGSTGVIAGKFGVGLRGMAGAATAAATTIGLAGGAMVGAMVTVGVKTAAANEQAQTAFTNMLGSAGAAREYLGELKRFAASTPFELPDVQMGAQRLMAMGVATRDVLPYMTAIGDAVSGMGGSADQINQVVLAIGQIQAKGKVQGDELMQLTEAGIPALKILADQYGVTTAQIAKMSEQGKVSADKALPLLIDGIENGTKSTKAFGGMMEEQSKTLSGRWSTIKDTVTQGLAGAVEPLLPLLGKTMEWVADKLPAGMALLEQGGKKVGAVFNVMRPAFQQAWESAKILARAFADGFRSSGLTLDDFRTGAKNLSDLLQPGSPFMVGMARIIQFAGWLTGEFIKVNARAEAFTKTLQFLGGIVDGYYKKIGRLTFGVQSEVSARTSNGPTGLLLGGGSKNTGSAYNSGAATLVPAGGIAGQRQGGGNVTAGNLYKINERGGEGFIPAQGGRIVPTRPDVRGMLDGGDITVHVPLSVNDEVFATATVRGVRRQAARRR